MLVEVSRKWYEPTIVQDVSAKIPGRDPVGSFMKPNNLAMIRFPRVAPWMKTAMNEIGQKEIAGPQKANPRILEYHKAARYKRSDDSGDGDAWCAGFVSWVMKQHGYAPPQYAMRAISWKDFGESLNKPIFGAIGIKKRRGGGHVAFVAGQSRDGKNIYMLGGNQNDEVNITSYPKSVWDKFVIPNNYNNRHGLLPMYKGKYAVAGRED